MFQSNTKSKSFYLATYLLMLVTSLLLLWSLSGLGTMLIFYWFVGVQDILNDQIIIYWISMLAVVLPMHLLSYWKTYKVDKTNITVFSTHFANGMLGVYLFVVFATIILLATGILALFLNAQFGIGEFDKHFWATLLSLLQAVIWFYYCAKRFAGIRTNIFRPKLYTVLVSFVGILAIVLSMVFPVMAYRDVAEDFKKEIDLTRINQSIADYVEVNEKLPASLNDISNLSDDTKQRLGNYHYVAKGETKFGIFGYELCATFAHSKGKGHDTGFGFASHQSGRQCFTRTTISFDKLNQELAQYVQNIENGAVKLQATIVNFLLGAKNSLDQEISGVESFASLQVKQLETHLEGLEGGTTDLQQEMSRLEGNLSGLQGNTGELAKDFAEVEKFFHDLGCLFGGCPIEN